MTKTVKKTTPKSYTSSFRDQFAGIQFKLGKLDIIVTREEFISYLTQAMYTFSRHTTVKGIDKMCDGTVIQPRGIGDYYILAGAKSPTDGFKLLIGGRLIVVPKGEDRYVYDCGNFDAWTGFYRDNFSQLLAKDVLLLHKLYSLCFAKDKTSDKDALQARLFEARKSLSLEGFRPIPLDEHLSDIAEFFCLHDPEMIVETSYRHMAVQFSTAITTKGLTDADVSKEVKALITENPRTCSIAILPLMLAALFIAEQGRNYTANIANLALFDLIERRIAIPKVGEVGWLTALATEEMVNLFHIDPLHKNGRKQADIGGWMTMSHTGSQGESTNINTLFGKMNMNNIPLAHAAGDPHIDLSFIHPMAKLQLAKYNHIMAPHEKANKSRDKAFIILATWLHSRSNALTVRLLGSKDIRLARKSYTKEKLLHVQKSNKIFLLTKVFPFLFNILDHYEQAGSSAYIRLQRELETELGCILSPAIQNDNSQFVAIIRAKISILTSFDKREDFKAMELRHEVVNYINAHKDRFREAITRTLELPVQATDAEIEAYCLRMNQYAEAGDEVTLLATSELIQRPIVVLQRNEREEIVGLVYGVSPLDVLYLDKAIVLTHNNHEHYDPVEHRTSGSLSSLIQHDGPILETIDSHNLRELQKLTIHTKLMKQFHERYIFRRPIMGSVSAFFTADEVRDFFAPSPDGPEESEISETVKQESTLLAQK